MADCCCSPLGAGPSPGGGAPLPDALYVAQGAAAGGNGSIGAPFDTMAGALLALANLGVNFGALLISPGDYSGEGVLHWVATTALMLKGYSAGVPFPDPFAGPNPQVQLPSITADTGSPDLYLDNVTLALSQQFNGFTNIFGVGCELQSVLTAGNLSLRASRMVGSMTIGGDLRLWNCEAQTDTNWNVGGALVELVGTKLISFSAPIVFGSAGVVTVDEFSNFYFVARGVAITNGTKQVQGAPPSFDFFATGPGGGVSAGDIGFSDAHTLTGAPFAVGQGFILNAVIAYTCHVDPGFFECTGFLQASYDGGATWLPASSESKFSVLCQHNPTWCQVSITARLNAAANAVPILVRFGLANDGASASGVINISAPITAVACTV
jgi:hypothetical protein